MVLSKVYFISYMLELIFKDRLTLNL